MPKDSKRKPEEISRDPAAVALYERACQMEAETAFSRADSLVARLRSMLLEPEEGWGT